MLKPKTHSGFHDLFLKKLPSPFHLTDHIFTDLAQTIKKEMESVSKGIYIHQQINYHKYDSSELGEELCPVSRSLSLRVHKLYIRVSFLDTFLRWLPPFVTNSCHHQQRKKIPFYSLLGSGCVLISYTVLSLIIAWLG